MKVICKVYENIVRSNYYLFKDFPNCKCKKQYCKYNFNENVYSQKLNSYHDKLLFDIQCYWASIPTYKKK